MNTPVTHLGYDLYPVEVQERARGHKWVVWFRCEIHQDGKLIDITPRRSSRTQALKDGESRAGRLRLLETSEVTA